MNSVYLYLHRIMINCTPLQNKILTKDKILIKGISNERIIDRKKALHIISRYLKFIPKLKNNILDDMVELKLLEQLNVHNYRIINEKQSETIDSELLLKIAESGMEKKNGVAYFITLFLGIKLLWYFMFKSS